MLLYLYLLLSILGSVATTVNIFVPVMKKAFVSYTNFTRKERAGLVAISGIILILLVVYTTMDLWVKPNSDEAANARINEAWQKYRRAQEPTTNSGQQQFKKAAAQAAINERNAPPDTLNVNAADSIMLVKIKGISPGNAGKIGARRKLLNGFRTYDELRRSMITSDPDFELIKKHLLLGPYKK